MCQCKIVHSERNFIEATATIEKLRENFIAASKEQKIEKLNNTIEFNIVDMENLGEQFNASNENVPAENVKLNGELGQLKNRGAQNEKLKP